MNEQMNEYIHAPYPLH